MLMGKFRFFVPLILVFMVSCASTVAPRGWVPKANELPRDVFGSWIEVITRDNKLITGELIAVQSDTLFVAKDRLIAIPKDNIKVAKLIAYDMRNTGSCIGIILFTLLGTASTISHGFFLILTAPAWILTGTVSCLMYHMNPHAIITYPSVLPFRRTSLEDFKPFARYPQGLPPDIDRSLIRMR